MKPLSEAQRRLLLELVICEARPTKTAAKKANYAPLVERGLAAVEKNPSRRGEIVVATETGWVWVMDHLGDPFTSGSVGLRQVWNQLSAKLSAYLSAREDNLSSVLHAEPVPPERSAPVSPGIAMDPVETLRRAYLSLSGDQLGRRVGLAALRNAAGLERSSFDRTLVELQAARRVVLFPEDERDRLRAEDHAAAISVSGVPQHIVYWER